MKHNSITGECPDPCGIRPYVRPQWCRTRLRLVNNEPSMTQQSHTLSTDVNHIINRFHRDGYLPANTSQPVYGDCTGLQGDLTELYNEAQGTIDTTEEYLQKRAEEERRATFTPPTQPADTPPATQAEPQPIT